eukprot:403358014
MKLKFNYFNRNIIKFKQLKIKFYRLELLSNSSNLNYNRDTTTTIKTLQEDNNNVDSCPYGRKCSIGSDDEVINVQNNKIFKQKRLRYIDGIFLITSVAVGCGFQFLLAPIFQDPITTSFLLILFTAATLISCEMLFETVQLTNLSSLPEIAYYLGGGRTSIYFISFALISFYLSLPSQYLGTQINIFVQIIFSDFRHGQFLTDPMIYNISTILVSVLLFPLCLIKDFQKIKILSYMIIVLNISLFINMTCLIFIYKDFPKMISESNFYNLNSPWMLLGEFSQLYQMQIFYLWVMQSTPETKRQRVGRKLYYVPVLIILLFTVIYCILIYFDFTVNINTEVSHEMTYPMLVMFFQENMYGKIFYWQCILCVVLVFPFQFYIGKEFFFVLFDEIINKSLSNKIDELKTLTSTKNRYTKEMVLKLKDDLYQIVRQPYLRISNMKYYAVCLLIYIPNVLLSLQFFSGDDIDNTTEALLKNIAIKLMKSPILPYIMFFLPGMYYYKACVYFQIENQRKKYYGIAMAIFGVIMVTVITSFSIYSAHYLLANANQHYIPPTPKS